MFQDKSITPGQDAGAIAYRPDIDGLRAIAVLSVVFYHAHAIWLPGGFVGVDIFFVISGYLIGGQIFRSGSAGSFSYANFYAKRVRRILPALLALLTLFGLFGFAAMTPFEFMELAKESIAAIFGLSNLYFFQGGGYFDPAADMQPLLMSWSLGVEEQFYFILPIILLIILKIRRDALLPALAALCVITLIASFWLTGANQKAAFYLLPTRAWELGIGACLAIWEAGRKPIGSPDRLAWLGLSLITLSFLLYTPEIAFPGWFAVVPVMGTALLIAVPQSTPSRTLLSRPEMQFVGKISYSLYLWHWPIFYAYRLLGGSPGLVSSTILVALSFTMAVLSWKFIEHPFRHSKSSQHQILVRYACTCGLIGAAFVGIYKTQGFAERMPGVARRMALNVQESRNNPCLVSYGATEPANLDTCLPRARGDKAMLLMGDSHASALAFGVREFAAREGASFAQLTKTSCLPLKGYALDMANHPGHAAQCIAYQDRAFAAAFDRADVETLVLSGLWSAPMPIIDAEGRKTDLETALKATLDAAKARGKHVVLVQDVPAFNFDPYTKVLARNLPLRATLESLVQDKPITGNHSSSIEPAPARTIISQFAGQYPDVQLVDPYTRMCGVQGCTFATDTLLYYSDNHHVTMDGARLIFGDVKLP